MPGMKKTKPPPAPPPHNRHERRKTATQARQKANREAKKPRWHLGPAPIPPTEVKLSGKSLTISVANEAKSELRAALEKDPHAQATINSKETR